MEGHVLWPILLAAGFSLLCDWRVVAVQSADKFPGEAAFQHDSIAAQEPSVLLRQERSPCDSGNCTHQLEESETSDNPENPCPEGHYLAEDGVTCNARCSNSQFQCKGDSSCIPYWWRCNRVDDCKDGSDEPENCGEFYCKHAGVFQCANATSQADCILPTHVCDGIHQCADESDEQFCSSYACLDEFAKCEADDKCIPESLWCDGENHCTDGQDEKECASDRSKVNCGPDEFRCFGTGQCIPKSKVCDGKADCGDHDISDEDSEECHDSACLSDSFRCLNDHCIKQSWRCDHTEECQDGSDEIGCSFRHCRVSEFRCYDGQCIPLSAKCNGAFDCNDRSDEDCDRDCAEDQFKCKDFHCIPRQQRCDGRDDCGDGHDEENCASYACLDGFTKCEVDGKCIPESLWCDGEDHCPNGQDEKDCSDDRQPVTSRPDSCLPSNGGCDHHCEDGPSGPLCSCKQFYDLDSDGKTCTLEDPCLQYDTCPQYCAFDENRLQFTCSCARGYEAVDSSCKAIGSEPEILLAERGNVLTLTRVEELDSTRANVLEKGSNKSYIISVDVDIGMRTAFFINHADAHYYLMKKTDIPILQTSRKRRTVDSAPEMLLLQDRQLFAMQGVAVDWVGQHIYLTDATNGAIHVYNYDGQRSKTVVKGDLGDPSALAVDPLAGRIFWVDRGPKPKIESANLDGSDRKVIVSSAMAWPNGLALDTNKGWLYWADTKKHAVEVARYDGSGRKILYTTIFAQDPPLSLEVFEDAIYVLTYKESVLLKLHRFDVEGEKNMAVLFNTVTHARDIKVVQENKHLQVQSNCTDSCEETQICFNKPHHPQGYVCLCPDGATFADGKCNFAKHQVCQDYCLNNGHCEMAPVSGKGKPKCRCKEGYTGSRCETATALNSTSSSGSGATPHSYLMVISVLVVICAILIVVVFVVALKLHRSRWRSQYSRKTIDLVDDLHLSDMVFAKDGHEQEPLGSAADDDNEEEETLRVSNFANPMYEMFHGDAQQELMPSRTEVENHNRSDLNVVDRGTERVITPLNGDVMVTSGSGRFEN